MRQPIDLDYRPIHGATAMANHIGRQAVSQFATDYAIICCYQAAFDSCDLHYCSIGFAQMFDILKRFIK
ncbi:hypothetical protein NX02_28755 [Sphingomonas sanxanigenens DSM 19645 = NX02]|uniref:Uncharacterized protein n=1 Tax=Sphingomonas sanxanigenens DSM 19645 = NX02 TaxID=1123269 RepID=W0AL66_9SPHN|nr:hypothetical protein NX02_28755 [Sphingomonas sanxanigenens DSM 19645 = NX02]